MEQPKKLNSRVVKPQGPRDATSLWLGEAPGYEENLSGLPFQGQAGQLLNRAFSYKGIARVNIRIDNIFNQQPPKNNIGYFFNDKKKTEYTWEAEEHLAALKKRIEAMPNLNLIVAMGDVPLYVLTGKKGIWKWRGSVLPCTLVPGKKVYPTLHPSGINRLINEPEERLNPRRKTLQQNALPLFLIDLDRIKKQWDFPEIRKPQRTFNFCTDFHSACTELNKLLEEQPELVGVDIETIPTKYGTILWMMGFAPKPDYAFNIPFLLNLNCCWTVEQEGIILDLISKVFLSKMKKVFQGGLYDLSILGRYFGLRVADGTYEDTMLCHHASYPYLRKSLATLASIYTWERYYKGEGRGLLGNRTDEAEANYNSKDGCVTREILPVVHRDAHELETYDGYCRTLSVIPSLLGMMLRGVRIDMTKKRKLALKFALLAKKYRIIIQRWVRDMYKWPNDININSHVQLKNLLYDEMGLPGQINHKTKKLTSDREALEKLIKKTKSKGFQKIIQQIMEYKKYAKLSGTYANMQVDSDGRIHTSYTFVSTWRLSSSESPFGNGGNLQNIPAMYHENGKAIRQLFIPDDGMKIGCADYSQAEAMVVDWEAGDVAAIKEYGMKRPGGVHWKVAKMIFGMPEDMDYDKEQTYNDKKVSGIEATQYMFRQLGKRIRHAMTYGMGPRMLQGALAQEGFVVAYGVCVKLLKRAQQVHPFITQWQRKIREKVKATRKLTSSYGRVRYFMGRVNDNLFRAAYAFSPQNTVGEMLECSMQRIWNEVDFVDILLNNHDEVVFQYPIGRRAEAEAEVRRCMEEEIIIKGRPLVIPVDFKFGKSWGDAK